MSYVFQAVWPIVDDTLTRDDLIAEALAELEDLADQAHAVVTGPPVWLVEPAERVPGWTAYAPRPVLIARCPAEYVPTAAWADRVDVDEVAVERALSGRGGDLGHAERVVAVRRAAGWGWSDSRIAERVGMVPRRVQSLRKQHQIPPGVPCTRRSA